MLLDAGSVAGGVLLIALAFAGFLVVAAVCVIVLRLLGVVLGDADDAPEGGEPEATEASPADQAEE